MKEEIFAVLLVLAVGMWLYDRRARRVSKYEYLEALSHMTWKSGPIIREELEDARDVTLKAVDVHENLGELVMEKLVVYRNLKLEYQLPRDASDFQKAWARREYRLSDDGRRKRIQKPENPRPELVFVPA